MDLIFIYILLIEMDEIIEDIKIIEEDIKEIRCGPIQKFFKDFFKCIKDTLLYCFKSKN